MSIQDVIRAWKDSSYRATLSEEQLASLPANPVGDSLSDEELREINGGIMQPTATAQPHPTQTVDTNHHHHHHHHPKPTHTVDTNHNHPKPTHTVDTNHHHQVPPTF